MGGRKLAKDGRGVKEVSFVEGLRRMVGDGCIRNEVTEQEKALFERAKFAEEESKRKSFALGRQLV